MTKTVYLKEMRETLRDKRVVIGVVVFPLLVMPILLAAVTFFATKKVIDQQTSTMVVQVIQEGDFPQLLDHIEADNSLKVEPASSRASSIAAIEDRSVRAAIVIKSDSQIAFDRDKTANLEIIYDQANEKSEAARQRLRKLLDSFNRQAIEARLQSKELASEFIRPTEVKETSIASKESMGGFILGAFLPYLVVMGAAFGGMTTAFDLCAGEKERGTMETLLVSPASRYEIVMGKLFTIFTISLCSALCLLAGFIIPIQSGLSFFSDAIGNSISISYTSIFAILAIVAPLALLTSSGLLAVSSFARNQKEAQTYIFPFMMAVLFPAMLSSILGAESPFYTAFIPILNIALTMKQVLAGSHTSAYFVTALGSSFIYAFIAVRMVTHLFQRESILFRA